MQRSLFLAATFAAASNAVRLQAEDTLDTLPPAWSDVWKYCDTNKDGLLQKSEALACAETVADQLSENWPTDKHGNPENINLKQYSAAAAELLAAEPDTDEHD